MAELPSRASSRVLRRTAPRKTSTIDDRDDSTLNWMTLVVDEVGCMQVVPNHGSARTQLEAADEQSRGRLEVTGQIATRLVVGLAAFEVAERNGNYDDGLPS